jgi:hypothetical protein
MSACKRCFGPKAFGVDLCEECHIYAIHNNLSPLCKLCWTNKANPGYINCEQCHQKSLNSQQSSSSVTSSSPVTSIIPPTTFSVYNQAAEICTKCNKNPVNPGHKWCEQCFRQSNTSSPSTSSVICTKCKKNTANPGQKWCEQCFQQSKLGQSVQQSTFVCVCCRTNTCHTGSKYCSNCYGHLKQLGLCTSCHSQPANPGFNQCQKCFLLKKQGSSVNGNWGSYQ